MAVRFCSVASGSSGNSIYAGTEHTHILFDAGLSGKRIQEGLGEIGIDGTQIDALFITHEHSDHIKGAGILSRRFDIPIYATPGTWEAMEGQLGAISYENKQFVYQGEHCVINDLCVKPFAIPHDAAEPVGYSVFTDTCKMTIATDIGHITDTLRENLMDSNILLLESNHDIQMLKNGSYTWALKQRVLGENGHLSNVMAGQLLSEVMSGKLEQVFLGHLSGDNNFPSLALRTVKEVLEKNGISVEKNFQLELAHRHKVSRMIER